MRLRQTDAKVPREGASSPWGAVQGVDVIVPAHVVSVSTSSHGGIWVSPEVEATIPAACQALARHYAPAGWYEEDCDCLIPMALVDGFEPRHVAIARRAVRMDARYAAVAAELDRRGVTG